MSSITNSSYPSIEAKTSAGSKPPGSVAKHLAFPPNWFLALIAAFMFVAFGISAYLTYVSATAGEVAGCSGGQLFDCSHVIYSKWSKFLGIPVSGLALLTYTGMIAATFVASSRRFSSSTRQWSWTAVSGLAVAAALAGIYFIVLQAFVLKHFCPWCLGAHACGIAIASSILYFYRNSVPNLTAVSGLAAAGLAVMIGVQVVAEDPPKYSVITLDESETAVVPVESAGGTYVTSPVDDEGMMLPPSIEEDDNFFAPPVDDVGDFGEGDPPSEDTDASEEADLDYDPTIEGETAAFERNFSIPAAIFSPSLVMTGLLQESGAQAQDEGKAKAKPKKPERKTRVVKFLSLKLNAYDWPIVGKPSAKHVFVEMFDYTCPHCRTTNRAITEAKAKMGDDLAVVVLPVPMKRACNPTVAQDHHVHHEACELSRLAIAVWRCDGSKFCDFHDWMFEGETAPTFAVAKAKAESMIGPEKLNKEFNKKTPQAYINLHVNMYKKLNAGVVPKLIFPRTAIQGQYTSTDGLISLIKEQTGN